MWHGFEFGIRFERHLNRGGGCNSVLEYRLALEGIRTGKIVLPTIHAAPEGTKDLGSAAVAETDKLRAAQILEEFQNVLEASDDEASD